MKSKKSPTVANYKRKPLKSDGNEYLLSDLKSPKDQPIKI